MLNSGLRLGYDSSPAFKNFSVKNSNSKNSPKLNTSALKSTQKRNLASIKRISSSKQSKKSVPHQKLKNIQITPVPTVCLTPDPLSSYERQHLSIQKLSSKHPLDQKILLKSRDLEPRSHRSPDTVVTVSSFREMSGGQIEQFFKDFTKKVELSSERAKQALLERAHYSEKLFNSIKKSKRVNKEIETGDKKMTIETVKSLSKSLLETSKHAKKQVKEKNKLSCVNKKHHRDWEKKYERIQMVKTNRERKSAERSLEKQQKSKETSEAIEKMLKKGNKKEIDKSADDYRFSTERSNNIEVFRQKLKEKIRELGEDKEA